MSSIYLQLSELRSPGPGFNLYSTPTKENFNSLNINDNQITPLCHINDNFSNFSNNDRNFNLKQVIFNITKSKQDSSSDSSITQYLKTNNNASNIKNIDYASPTPTKKNLFSIFERTLESPKNVVTPKKTKKNLFECSASSTNYITSTKKKRRCRKNKEQIARLNQFYNDGKKKWTRSEIREISVSIGIKETKVYKWLWDKKNKEEKRLKFYIMKN